MVVKEGMKTDKWWAPSFPLRILFVRATKVEIALAVLPPFLKIDDE